MMYRPADSDLFLWDTWLLRHEGQYHLFHLQTRSPDRSDQVGRAVSKDLINWETLPTIYLRGKEGDWDGNLHRSGLRTGYTTPVPGGFAMTYGTVHERREVIGVAFSRDLISWEKCQQNPVLYPSGQWYENDPNKTAMFWVAWRDPFTEPMSGSYEALICARSSKGDHGAKACIARAFTRDFIKWEILPPLVEPGCYNSMECPERFELNGRWYLTFSTGTEWGRPLSTPSRKEVHGTFYMVSDYRDGPYHIPGDNLLIGSRLLSSTLHANPEYAARSIIGPDGERLLYGMNIGHRTSFSTPKIIHADDEGLLYLRFWENLLYLETGKPVEGFANLKPFMMGNVVLGKWGIEDERAIAQSGPDTSIVLFQELWTDIHWTCEFLLSSGEHFALLVHVDDNLCGTAIVFDFERSTISLSASGRGNQFGILFTPYDVIHKSLSLGRTYKLRVMTRDEFVEVYVDDVLIFSVTQFKHNRQGRLGFSLLGEIGISRNRVIALEQLP